MNTKRSGVFNEDENKQVTNYVMSVVAVSGIIISTMCWARLSRGQSYKKSSPIAGPGWARAWLGFSTGFHSMIEAQLD